MNYVLEVIKETWPVILIMGVIAVPVLYINYGVKYIDEDEYNSENSNNHINQNNQ